MGNVSRRDVMTAGVGLFPFLGLAALAQPPGTAVPAGAAPPPGAAPGAPPNLDPALAGNLLIMGAKQIAICRFALDRLQDVEVRRFAQSEIEEHETNRASLARLGYEYPGSPSTQAAEGVRRGAADPAVIVGRAALPPGTADCIALEHEVAEQAVTTARDELGELQGLRFDERFVGHQLDAHYVLFDHAVVFRKHASAELAPVLDTSRPIIERHIAACKELMARLETARQGS